ncbi:S8 family serine peptidase [Azospirillum sp. sgz302134]
MPKKKSAAPGAQPAGGYGTRNLMPTTAVVVTAGPGVRAGTPVSVDGEPGFLAVGRPGIVEVGMHRFAVSDGDVRRSARRPCPPGRTLDDPFPIDLSQAWLPAEPAPLAPTGVTPKVRSLRPQSETSFSVSHGARPEAETIVYIHGIGNKPPASVLKCQWDMALFGTRLGDRSRMAYWVNRDFYPVPEDAGCEDKDSVAIEDDEASSAAIMALAGREGPQALDEREHEALAREIGSLTRNEDERAWLGSLARRMRQAADVDEEAIRTHRDLLMSHIPQALRAPEDRYAAALAARDMERIAQGYSSRVLPLPAFMRRLVTSRITRAFLRDVHEFFYVPERRAVMTQSLVDRLNAGGGPFVVIAHSQGSMIAYEVLRQLKKSDCDVRLFVTIGSPLGLQEVQDVFRQWDPQGLRVPACVDRWVNVADRLDPVAFDSDLSDDVTARAGGPAVENVAGWGLNEDSPRHPHSGTGYLRTRAVQDAVRAAVGGGFAQPVARAVIARDLVEGMEDSLPDAPHRVLIQLSEDAWSTGAPRDLGETSRQLVEEIRDMARSRSNGLPKDPPVDALRRYVSAELTRAEIERLRTRFADLDIQRIWRNAQKRALLHASASTVQARTANMGYQALGQDIGWAVVDTGIAGDHPHFQTHRNVVQQWDCTVPGQPIAINPGTPHFDRLDGNGHGTHVAGIIAGGMDGVALNGRAEQFHGIAPRTRLYGFKVLDDQGFGQDSWIIKALDQIAEINERSSRPVIHGVNLSLGGNFDPSVYGVGHTPLCQELRRLWGQGVVVCLAAGNEGYALLQGESGLIQANLDLSIGDPANLEEAIAVGSVHKTNPHTYGVSYFSSRGPTADGRPKPDLVAPGEQILSAWHDYPRGTWQPRADDLYVQMSGTSMAAPHVSGVIAAFLSVRREFIGYPDRVKRILLDNCTSLNRESYFQGAGMPNLVKMLANT